MVFVFVMIFFMYCNLMYFVNKKIENIICLNSAEFLYKYFFLYSQLQVIVEERYSKEAYQNHTSVLIEVIDRNDNTPSFLVDSMRLSVNENLPPPVILKKVNFFYSFESTVQSESEVPHTCNTQNSLILPMV